MNQHVFNHIDCQNSLQYTNEIQTNEVFISQNNLGVQFVI